MTEKQKRILQTVAIVSDTARNLTDDPSSLTMLQHAIDQVMALARIEADIRVMEHEKSSN